MGLSHDRDVACIAAAFITRLSTVQRSADSPRPGK
jgi:hypothetical protein